MIDMSPLIPGVAIAIELNRDFFGVDCDIYYPIGNVYETSIHYEGLKYKTEPDISRKMLFPFIFEFSYNQIMVADVYNSYDFTTYVPGSELNEYPSGTLFKFEYSGFQYQLVKSSGIETIRIPQGPVVGKFSVVPYGSFVKISDTDDQVQEYEDLVDERTERLSEEDIHDHHSVAKSDRDPTFEVENEYGKRTISIGLVNFNKIKER